MTNELQEALKNLRSILQNECNPHTTSVNVFINCEGYEISYTTRSPGGLKRSGISMRNIKGDFIK